MEVTELTVGTAVSTTIAVSYTHLTLATRLAEVKVATSNTASYMVPELSASELVAT